MPTTLPDGTAERLKSLLKQAKRKSEFQRIQAVYLRAATAMTPEEIADALVWKPGTVRNIHSAFLRKGDKAFQLCVAADTGRIFQLMKRMRCSLSFSPMPRISAS
jgi:hypothetical protein